ncbi:Dolichyl-phosphate-mannose-protein mannosyltransferase [Rhodoferax sp. OV413]|uniref:glycosyltransferase family 39 protein n=1 Tax=Rhodoferax sp. OV413 TaxID=1855285 RepID=UPI0008840E81|nr:glycosyltransferase family 39 protein [Rhodoferax sp. OV413]SDP45085.1 Dolichyl-phosphate-mannose-protein mannosyltransferase [Rhodoferax sp. OV413]
MKKGGVERFKGAELNFSLKWKLLSGVFAIAFFVFSMHWSVLDNSPPAWDQGHYLYQATFLHKVFVEKGWTDFLSAAFNIDPGRVPLILLVVQPSFYFFGPSLDAAVFSINLFWFLLVWALLGVMREVLAEGDSAKAGFFTLLLVGVYPMTIMLLHNFLVEILVVSFVCASIYSVLMLNRKETSSWSLIIGIFVGLGMLTKVTFVVFVFPSILLTAWNIFRRNSLRRFFRLLFPGLFVGLLIAGPYYFFNLREILSLTTHLSSKNLAKMYGFGEIFDVWTIINYWHSIFLSPVFLVAIVSFFLLKGRLGKIFKGNYEKLVILLWFSIPFVMATFGEIKDPRYLYPGLIPVFIVSGMIFASLGWSRFVVLGFAVVSTFPGYLFSNAVLSKHQYSRVATISGLSFLAEPDSSPDGRDWRVGELVQKIKKAVNGVTDNDKIFFLGGNRYYHLRLLDYYGLIFNSPFKYQTLPYYADPDMSEARALEYINTSQSLGVLYKTGENWPEFSSRLDSAIVAALRGDSRYIAEDLGIDQPDGSRFYLFKNKAFILKPITSPDEITAKWLVGGGIAEIARRDGDFLTIRTETGAEGSALLRDGAIHVKDWGVTGQLTADAASIRWSNGSIWRRASAE